MSGGIGRRKEGILVRASSRKRRNTLPVTMTFVFAVMIDTHRIELSQSSTDKLHFISILSLVGRVKC